MCAILLSLTTNTFGSDSKSKTATLHYWIVHQQ